jgi:hypothetical protein
MASIFKNGLKNNGVNYYPEIERYWSHALLQVLFPEKRFLLKWLI